MSILLLAEHTQTTLSEQTGRALAAALKMQPSVDILVCGAEVAVAEAARFDGVRKVVHVEAAWLNNQLPEAVSAVVIALASDYDAFVAPATSNGKSIAPRVAALLDVGQISEITEVLGSDTFKRPIYAGNAVQTVQATDPFKVITVRTSAFDVAPFGGSAPIERITPPADPDLSLFVDHSSTESDRPELSSARIVVSGGRALGSADAFQQVIAPLADKLGAAIGASRAAVDAGYAPNDWQVGQTGKVIAPDLYIACGISGAIQHLAGMKDSKTIVAINNDPEAPIFQIADYGIVGDLFQILPDIEKELAPSSGH